MDLRFRYMTTDTTAGLFGEMCFRTSSTNALTNNTVLRMSTDGMKLQKVVAGVVTVLDNEPSATATANTWYRVRILAKGTNVTVWRGEGDDGPMEEVLSSGAVPTLTTVSMWFISGANSAFAYDDVAIVANGWTSDTTFATNGGNELTSSTFGGVTTTYGYDAWGRMTAKARGSYSAAYAWHYGGKLTGVTSDFPSEGTVTYAYGGDGKRRERDDGTAVTWYNWGAGEALLNEEDGSGTLLMTHVGALASVAGASPASGDYRYHAPDGRGTNRHTRDQAKASVGVREYDPYGVAFAAQGAQPQEGFAGHRWDPAAGLLFSNPYAPTLGRPISPSKKKAPRKPYDDSDWDAAYQARYYTFAWVLSLVDSTWGIPDSVTTCLAYAETRFDPLAVSKNGNRFGYMQVGDSALAQFRTEWKEGKVEGIPGLQIWGLLVSEGAATLYEEQNIALGTWYLRYLLDKSSSKTADGKLLDALSKNKYGSSRAAGVITCSKCLDERWPNEQHFWTYEHARKCLRGLGAK